MLAVRLQKGAALEINALPQAAQPSSDVMSETQTHTAGLSGIVEPTDNRLLRRPKVRFHSIVRQFIRLYGKGKGCVTPKGAYAECSSPILRTWVRRWINHWVCDAWQVQHQTHGCLPSRRASLPSGPYQFIMLADSDRGTFYRATLVFCCMQVLRFFVRAIHYQFVKNCLLRMCRCTMIVFYRTPTSMGVLVNYRVWFVSSFLKW